MTERSWMIVLYAALFFVVGSHAFIHWWGYRSNFIGSTIPDARFLVVLSNPMHDQETFTLLDEYAKELGFSVLIGNASLAKGKELAKTTSGYKYLYRWRHRDPDTGGPNYSDHQIEFGWDHYYEWVREVLFAFYNRSTDAFTEREWELLVEWREVRLPALFPDSEIKIRRHPALFTARETAELLTRRYHFPDYPMKSDKDSIGADRPTNILSILFDNNPGNESNEKTNIYE